MDQEKYLSSLKNYERKISEYFTSINNLEVPIFDQFKIDCKKLNLLKENNYKLLKDAGINDKDSFLYYFKIVNSYNKETIQTIIQQYKDESEKDIKFPKVQKHQDSDILYLGKCNCGFLSRLKVHLGYVSKGTYGLHLLNWFDTLTMDCDLQLDLFFAKIDSKNQLHLLEIIETSLHHHFRPILGREGS